MGLSDCALLMLPQVDASSDAPSAIELPPRQPCTSPLIPAAPASTEPAPYASFSTASSLAKQAKPIAAAAEEPKATGDLLLDPFW